MSILKKIIDKNGFEITSQIEEKYIDDIKNITGKTKVITNSGQKIRIGKISSEKGTVYAISKSKDHIKSSSKFIAEIELIHDSLDAIYKIMQEAESRAKKDTARLIHNLTSINAHSIQDIYSLIPQESLAGKFKEQIHTTEQIILKNTKETAKTLLKIAKHNAAVKAEFSVFSKLFDESPQLNPSSHIVHKVLTNVLYLFFADFTDKNIKIKISPSDSNAYFDYESIHVALYHILDNAVKYAAPNTEIEIQINDDNDSTTIKFDMISMTINPDEREKIFLEGFSGQTPKSTKTSGSGIGMGIIAKALSLNNGVISIEIKPDTIMAIDKIPYQRNIFSLSIPKKRTK